MSIRRSKPLKQQAARWREKFLAWWTRVFHEYSRHHSGRKGERAAARFLRKHGHKILRRNVRYRYGELDLITLHGETVVFVEVRSRQSGTHADLYRSINEAKKRRLYHAVRSVVKRYRLGKRPLRFDIITIVWPPGTKPDIRHHQAALRF